MRRSLGALAVVGLFLVGCASSGKAEADAEKAMREGVRAATRKYWQEALFRFEQARSLAPNEPGILNNLAIALEAMGRYDEALVVYKRGLEVAPKNLTLKRNYARFAEFYTSYARGVKPKREDNATR